MLFGMFTATYRDIHGHLKVEDYEIPFEIGNYNEFATMTLSFSTVAFFFLLIIAGVKNIPISDILVGGVVGWIFCLGLM